MLSGPLAKMAAGTHETKTQPVLLGRYSPRRGRNVSIFTQDPVSEALPVFCFVLFLISIGSYALPSARVRGGTRCRLSSAADQTLPGIPAASRLASPRGGPGPHPAGLPARPLSAPPRPLSLTRPGGERERGLGAHLQRPVPQQTRGGPADALPGRVPAVARGGPSRRGRAAALSRHGAGSSAEGRP